MIYDYQYLLIPAIVLIVGGIALLETANGRKGFRIGAAVSFALGLVLLLLIAGLNYLGWL